ncbi:MAG: dTDP-6-deoxy-L-hexose 3-O-methyltransferase, partial [Lysobacteraceae bacterium]
MSKSYRPPADIDIWDAENVFYLKSHPSRLAKLLSHYEIYKQVQGLPGAIVECGVYKGASLTRFASFRALLENDHGRSIYGFDAFGAFPTAGVQSEADQEFITQFESAAGGGIPRSDLEDALAVKGFS